MRKIIYLLVFLLTINGALAFTIVENFDDFPDVLDWTYFNDTPNCQVTLDAGGILFNHSNLSSSKVCYYTYNGFINMSQDVTIQWKQKTSGDTGSDAPSIFGDRGGVGIGQGPIFDQNTGDKCGFAVTAQAQQTTDLYLYIKHNPTFFQTNTPTTAQDTDWHDWRMEWDASKGNISYFYDGGLRNEYVIDSGVCENVTNASVSFGGRSNIGPAEGVIWIDSLIIEGIGNIPNCAEPCLLNETFDYNDSICNHGWTAGDCSDLNLPINNRYVCNDSFQIIAYYLGRVTKDSGVMTFSYDLNIDTDYSMIFGFRATNDLLAIVWTYDNGTITEYRDNSEIGTYVLGTIYNYKASVDLNTHTWEFYIDNVLQKNNMPFFNDVEDLYYFFIQPDFVKGSPYCDYTLDNIEFHKTIVGGLTRNATDWTVGDYLDLDPLNASFNWELACNEGEHPTICFYRANFQSLLGGLGDFIFGNFILVLILIFILVVLIILRR